MSMSPKLLRPKQASKYAAIRSGLVAYWPLNETANSGDVTAEDWTKRGNNLTSNNSVLSVAGKIGNARQFATANSEYLSIASNADVQFGEAAWTIAFWFYVPTSATGPMQLFAKDSASGRELEINYNRNTNVAEMYVYCTDGTAPTQATVTGLSRDTWHFLAATHEANSATATLRVNAATSTTTRSGAKTFATTSTDLRIGARVYSGFQQYLTGNVDEVAKWSRALSATELNTIYNSGAGIDLRK